MRALLAPSNVQTAGRQHRRPRPALLGQELLLSGHTWLVYVALGHTWLVYVALT